MNAPLPKALFDAASDTLSSGNFDRLTRLIDDSCGIQMPPSKRHMLEGRLRRRTRVLGIPTVDAYCRYIFDEDNCIEELPHLINAVTTNKTDFFREPIHFDVMAELLLPEFVKQHDRAIRVWSAGCSTGAEPYTLAMVLDHFALQHSGFSYGILATDIDTNVLETARMGIYPRDIVAPVPPDMHSAYIMEPRERDRDDIRIAPGLRSTVGFAQLNLMDRAYPVGQPMDLIFCRNVLIYFDKKVQREVVSRLVDNLVPGGCLFLGHSEGAASGDPRLRQLTNTIYRRE